MKDKIITAVVIVAIAGICLAIISFPYWTADECTITVTDKDRVVKHRGDSVSSKYLVFTESETFENSDCFIRWKFNSSDIYGSLRVGKTYHVKVYGWRIPFLSKYRNIVRVD